MSRLSSLFRASYLYAYLALAVGVLHAVHAIAPHPFVFAQVLLLLCAPFFFGYELKKEAGFTTYIWSAMAGYMFVLFSQLYSILS